MLGLWPAFPEAASRLLLLGVSTCVGPGVHQKRLPGPGPRPSGLTSLSPASPGRPLRDSQERHGIAAMSVMRQR